MKCKGILRQIQLFYFWARVKSSLLPMVIITSSFGAYNVFYSLLSKNESTITTELTAQIHKVEPTVIQRDDDVQS